MRAALALVAALLTGTAGHAGDIPKLELHYGRDTQLSDAQQEALRSIALRLLESSNFNSQRHRDILKKTQTEVHAAYRKTLAGRYLVVTFETPRPIDTVGGAVVTREIVVGLNRPDYADALFTIDGEGRVVLHGKYSGGLCIELLNEVLKARPRA